MTRFAQPGPAFLAKYSSRCGGCGERISYGDTIRYIAKNTVAHARCCGGSLPPIPRYDPVLGPICELEQFEQEAAATAIAEDVMHEADESFGQWARAL